MGAKPDPQPTIEKAIERIEMLVAEMESGKLALEEVIGRFEEGAKLVKLCRDKLADAERRIEIILREAGQPAGVAPFGGGVE